MDAEMRMKYFSQDPAGNQYILAKEGPGSLEES